MPDVQQVTTDFILSILGAKVVELEALRIKCAQLEQAVQQPVVQAPPTEQEGG